MNEISVKIAKDGNPVPLWNGLQLHSQYQPLKEGADLASKFMADSPDSQKPVLVLGLGFGYHILPILDKYKTIFIAESCQALINAAKAVETSQPIFTRCTIISDTAEVPYCPDYYIFTLRSEQRLQEKFFSDVCATLKIENRTQKPQYEQIRVLINSPIYGGSYTTSQYVDNAFRSLSVCTRFTDNSPAYPLLKKLMDSPHQDPRRIQELTELLSNTFWQDIVDFKPHIVFFTAQSPFTESLMRDIAKANIVSIYWFVEDFRRMQYWKDICNSFDYFYVIQKSVGTPYMVSDTTFENLLETTCHKTWGWFPTAADPQTHKPLNLSNNDKNFYGSDISFMGAAYPNRVRFFKHFPKNKLKLWGTGWAESELKDYNIPLGDQRITTEQSNIIYQASKININLHSSNDSYQDTAIFDPYGDFVNPRTFEIAACGGFQLVDDRPAIRELFDIDKDIVVFSSIEEALDKADFYLKNETLRTEIAKNAQQKVLQFHTYQHRIEHMLQVALKNSPIITSRVSVEAGKLDNFITGLKDVELKAFIDKLPNDAKTSFPTIIAEMKKSQGTLKHYEAALMLLETFYTGE